MDAVSVRLLFMKEIAHLLGASDNDQESRTRSGLSEVRVSMYACKRVSM